MTRLAARVVWIADRLVEVQQVADVVLWLLVKPMAEWMTWVDEQPHTLLGGKPRAGKTWLATALLERRIDTGADIFIIDPHSSDWMGLPTAGGSGTDERCDALKAVNNEYGRRMAIREAHKRRTGHELPHDYFDPLAVLVDEANALPIVMIASPTPAPPLPSPEPAIQIAAVRYVTAWAAPDGGVLGPIPMPDLSAIEARFRSD